MKPRLLLTICCTCLLSFLLQGPFSEQSLAGETLVAGGCITEYYLMKDLTDSFNSDDLSIDLRKTGNMRGMMMFAKGGIDFAFLSMPHMMLAKNMNMEPEATARMTSIEIAREPILIVVNRDVNVKGLTKDQVTAIYNGEITNWKEVGGSDLPIVPATLNENAESGLWAAFKKVTIGMMNDFKKKHTDLSSPSAINHFLDRTSGGITYIGFSTYNPDFARALSINDVEPTMDNFKNGSYPLVANYYLTYNRDNPGSVNTFIDFIYSPAGKKIINQKMIAVAQQ